MSSFLYAHCIDAMLNAVLSFRYLLLPDRIRSRCEERVRDQDRQHRRSVQVHQRTSQGKRIFSFEHICSRPFFKCFESPPDIICIRFNCLLSIDRVSYVDACLPFAAYISWSSAPSITRVLAYASARAFIYICLAMLSMLPMIWSSDQSNTWM